MKNTCLSCLILISLFLFGCVEPQKFVALENRVAAMEMENNRQLSRQNDETQSQYKKDIASLEKRLANSAGISKAEYADLKYEIQSAKENLQRLEGLIQEIQYTFDQYVQVDHQKIEKSIERLDNAISRNYEKILNLEKYMGFEPSGIQPDSSLPADSTAPVVNEEQSAYQQAKKMFDAGDRENARIHFENFINKYPKSDNADNSRFWIAESYYAEKWFEKAILEYQKVLEEYPDSNKLAAARLKQGYAFAELGENANARLILKELLNKHPDSNEAKYAREKLKNLK